MSKTEFYHFLEYVLRSEPSLWSDIRELTVLVYYSESDIVDREEVAEFVKARPALREYFLKFDRAELEALVREPEPEEEQPRGTVYPVHKPFPAKIRQRIRLAEDNEHYRNWANSVRAVPEYTLPLPEVNGVFIRSAKEIWRRNISGNEEALQAVLRHCIEYGKTGKTSPILLVGPPGVGKTLIAHTYSDVLSLPGSFVSGPSAAAGRGLSGAPNIYIGAGAGVIAQAMIDHKAGNPAICIDEIDKINGRTDRPADFQSELLSALDDSSSAWFDNYLEIEVDASHIPYIFTANETDPISPPLLDRMEVIRLESPTRDTIRAIVTEHTLPRALGLYEEGSVVFGEHEIEILVDLLWNSGVHSCRGYQKAIEQLVSSAYLKGLEEDSIPVRITEEDVRGAAALCVQGRKAKSIGFSD